MNVTKMVIGHVEFSKWGSDVCLDLGGLICNALFGPDPYIFLKTVPHKFCGNNFSCSTDGRVG